MSRQYIIILVYVKTMHWIIIIVLIMTNHVFSEENDHNHDIYAKPVDHKLII